MPLDLLPAPESADPLDVLVHLLLVLPIGVGSEHEVGRVPAAGAADPDAAAGQVVHYGPFLGDPDRVVQRQHHAAGVQPHPAGLRGQRGGEHRGVGEHAAEGVEVPLRQPHRVQPLAVGEARRLEDDVVLLTLLLAGIVAKEVQAEVGAGGLGGRQRGAVTVRHRDRRRRLLGGNPRQGPARRRRRRRRGTQQEAAPAQVVQRVAYSVDDELDVGIGMRVGQEEVAPLPDVHAFQDEVVEEQLEVSLVGEAEQRAEVMDPCRELLLGEELVQGGGEVLGAGVEPVLQRGTFGLEPGEYGLRRGHGHRVLDVGAAEEGGLLLGPAVVAVLPESAVDPVHDVGPAGDRTDREPAAEHLAVGGQVGLDPEDTLRAAQVRTESGEHLVEHQHHAVPVAQLPQRADELHRLPVGIPAGHRLQHDGRDPVGVARDDVQALRVAVAEDQHLRHRRVGDARRDRHRPDPVAVTRGATEHRVEVTVIGAVEGDDHVPPGVGSGQPEGRGVGLGAGGGEGGPVLAGELAQQLGGLARLLAARPQAEAVVQVRSDGVADEVRLVPEEQRAEAHGDVHVGVAVDILQVGALGPAGGERVQQLLGGAAEADHGAAVGQWPAIALRDLLRAGSLRGVAADQVGEVLLLRGGELTAGHPGRPSDADHRADLGGGGLGGPGRRGGRRSGGVAVCGVAACGTGLGVAVVGRAVAGAELGACPDSAVSCSDIRSVNLFMRAN